MTATISSRIRELTDNRVPFVHAMVVRAQVPASARAGDEAIVLLDGSIEGFVGGVCAETSVRVAGLGALADGQTVLLRVLPEDEDVHFPDLPGAEVVVNPCLSGGALEIFLQPMLPAPLIEVVGRTPVAEALVAIGDLLGYAMARSASGRPANGAAAVIVASHGRDEPEALLGALEAGTGYIALVASKRRGRAVLDELELTDDQRARISTPAGLDIGARTPPEVALSIMAEVVSRLRRPERPEPVEAVEAVDAATASAASRVLAPATAGDPVCGMAVLIASDTPSVVVDGEEFWFCSAHCRDAYAKAGR